MRTLTNTHTDDITHMSACTCTHTHTHTHTQGEAKPTGETVLANFFNSLLSKKQSGSKGGGSMRATTRNEAAAELERMQSKKSGAKT